MLEFKPLFLVLFLALSLPPPTFSIRSLEERNSSPSVRFLEAPGYRNGLRCPLVPSNNLSSIVCDPSVVHVAMTVDSRYLRGSIAAVHSILKHAFCPENVFFHFVAGNSGPGLAATVGSTFPSLKFKFYAFDESLVTDLISSSIRRALEHPLNYARIHLATILEPCVARAIYLDSDVVLVDDVGTLWSTALTGTKAVGAPEYCHVDVRSYFSGRFWSDPELPRVFEGKRVCYFNTGVMVMDLGRWREGGYTRKIERWMEVQRERRIYELGSLPPFLLVFGGEVEAIGHRWNQHGLGGDNVEGRCRGLHPGPVSLLHWSGKGKPWDRLDAGRACPVDYLWAPYDLYDHGRRPGKRPDHLYFVSDH